MDVSPTPPPTSTPAPAPTRDRRERLLDALGDPASRGILLMISDSPKSAQELLSGNRIPQSTLYRKLHELQQLGLVGIQRTAITAEGKRVDLYRSLLEEVRVELQGTQLRIQARFRDLAQERLKELWKGVRREAVR